MLDQDGLLDAPEEGFCIGAFLRCGQSSLCLSEVGPFLRNGLPGCNPVREVANFGGEVLGLFDAVFLEGIFVSERKLDMELCGGRDWKEKQDKNIGGILAMEKGSRTDIRGAYQG